MNRELVRRNQIYQLEKEEDRADETYYNMAQSFRLGIPAIRAQIASTFIDVIFNQNFSYVLRVEIPLCKFG